MLKNSVSSPRDYIITMDFHAIDFWNSQVTNTSSFSFINSNYNRNKSCHKQANENLQTHLIPFDITEQPMPFGATCILRLGLCPVSVDKQKIPVNSELIISD